MKAITSMATRHVLADLVRAAESAGLPAVQIESAGGVDAARRVASGDQFDLVFLAVDALSKLATEGHVDAVSVTPLLVSQVAVAVASGADQPASTLTEPAFPDSAGVREALLGATRVGYSTGPSGTALVTLIEEWGLTDQLGDRLVQARPGDPVARMLADGEVDLGFQQLSELAGQPGIRILGVLPPDCEIVTVFGGAVVAASPQGEAARGILNFLSSPSVAAIKARHSFQTPA